jgi:hypothetical protein
MNGQINLNTIFGQTINKISHMEENKIFLEIGTWNGQGSTHCVMDALLNREDETIFYSLEIEYSKYLEAVSLWNKIIIPKYINKKDILRLIYGSILKPDDPYLYKKEELKNLEGYQQIWESWKDKELQEIKDAPYVYDEIPSSIDVLILDGGEFCTLSEFHKLNGKINNFIILDDCNVLKCREVYKILSQNKEWEIYQQNLGDRNGYAIFKKIKK